MQALEFQCLGFQGPRVWVDLHTLDAGRGVEVVAGLVPIPGAVVVVE